MRYFFLTPVLGGPGAPRYPVTEQQQVIGRSEEADIALLEPTVSRRHAVVNAGDLSCWLEDLQSKHGTFVNSRRIQRAELKPGDIVVFGLSLVLRLEVANDPVPPAMPLRVPGSVGVRIDDGRQLETRSGSSSLFPQAGESNPGLLQAMPKISYLGAAPQGREAELVQARKMAGAGLFCLAQLPELLEQVNSLQNDLVRPPAEAEADDPDWGGLQRRLRQLQGGLLRMAEALGVAESVTPVPTELEPAIRQAIETLTARADIDDDYQVDLHLDGPLVALSDAGILPQALMSLLEVAIRCSFDGSTVVLSASESLKGVLVSLAFSGDMLSDELLGELARPTGASDQWHKVGLGYFEARQTLMAYGGAVTLTRQDKDRYQLDVVLPGAVG